MQGVWGRYATSSFITVAMRQKPHKSVSSKRFCPNSDSRYIGNLSTAMVCVCGKWFFVCLTWPVLRPGFRRWWPLFAVEYPQCLVEVDRETAASSPSPGRRRRAVVDHRVRWDPSTFWSGHPYFQRKLAVFPLSRRIHKIASLLASSQSTFYGESYNTSILPYPATSGKNYLGFVLTNGSHKRRFTFASLCFFFPSFAPQVPKRGQANVSSPPTERRLG